MKAKWITPVVTALDQKGHIDIEANKRIYDFLQTAVWTVSCCLAVSESFCTFPEEKKIMIREAVKHIRHRVTLFMWEPVIWNFRDLCELSNLRYGAGADGVMVISPYYFNLAGQCDSAFL